MGYLGDFSVPVFNGHQHTFCVDGDICVVLLTNNNDLKNGDIEFGISIGLENDLEVRWRKEVCFDIIDKYETGKEIDKQFPDWRKNYSVTGWLIGEDIVSRNKYINFKPEYHVKFPSITQFKESVKPLAEKYNSQPVPLVGYCKVHGVNGSLIFTGEEIIKQHKESVISVLDQYGLAHHVERHEKLFMDWGEEIRLVNNFSYPFIVAFEWAGGDIQHGSSVKGVEPFLAVFLVGEIKDGDVTWQMSNNYVDYPEINVYDIRKFGTYHATFDPVVPQNTQKELAAITIEVEEHCPIAKFFNIDSDKGEGVVWHPENSTSISTYFKVKGQKHSSVKVRKLASPNPEQLNGINSFIEYVITENRLEQGVQETGEICKENMGKFLSWMTKDVMKEEHNTLKENGLNWDKISKPLTSKCMQWYKAKL